MRKFVFLLFAALLCSVLVFAQTRTISGLITDANGKAIPFASVTVKDNPSVGTSADGDGKFTLRNVPAGAVLVITSMGYETREITVGTSDVLSVTLAASQGTEGIEVVVTTAFNIKRTQRNVSYASQNISSEQLNIIRQQNLNASLAGKVAGLQLRDQSYVKLGSNPTVRLRGEASFGGSTALYIVDGTPVNSLDINPDDIEDVTVLKGVTATALFGDRASGGAIVVNTKKGRKRPGLGIEINQGLRFDRVYILPEYQNSYAGGASGDLIRFDWQPGMPVEWQALDGKYYHDYTDDASWGPRMAGQEYIPWYAWYPGHKYSYQTALLTPQKDNIRDFYSTGVTTNNNINFTKVGDGYSTRLSYTYLNIKGLEPNSKQRKHTLNTSTSFDLGRLFKISANISYVTEDLWGQFADGYANQSTGSFNSWFHRNLDMNIIRELRGYRAPGNLIASWNHMNPGAYLGDPNSFYTGNYWFNFYDYFDNISNLNRRDRLFGDINLGFNLDNHFKINAIFRKNQVTAFNEGRSNSILDPKSGGAPINNINVTAFYATSESFAKEDNFELIPSYSNKFGDVTVNVNAGAAVRKELSKSVSVSTNGGLNVPDLYAINNSVNPISYSNGRSKREVRSVFGRGDIGYKNFVFGEFTLRNDWFSTLPPNNNSILYKSFGASFIFSDIIKNKPAFLSYGKLRASWGEVPSSLGIYQLGFNYTVGTDLWDGNFLMTTPGQIQDPNIKGAVNTLKEVGIELRLFKSKYKLDVTYYDEVRKDEPLALPITGTSGFTTKLLNVGKVIRKGIEVQVEARVFTLKDFQWTVNLNYGQNFENTVVEIAEGVDRIVVSSGAFSGSSSAYTAHFVGQRWGQMYGGAIKRNDDGIPVVDPNSGLFVKDPDLQQFGSVLPDFTGGVYNSFTYRNWVLNVNIDFQRGGKYFSLSDFWGTFSGLTRRTAALNDKGIPVRDPIGNGGGVHVVGVSSVDEKTPVDMYVDAQTYFHQFRGAFISENSIYDLTFVKLREVSLGYKIPVQKLGISKVVQNATFSIVSRNPWLIFAQNRDFDPSEISNVYGEDSQLPGTRSIGFNLTVGF